MVYHSLRGAARTKSPRPLSISVKYASVATWPIQSSLSRIVRQHLYMVLGTQLHSSAKRQSILNCWAISPVLPYGTFDKLLFGVYVAFPTFFCGCV